MNIIDAMKLVKDGKKAKRPSFSDGEFIYYNELGIIHNSFPKEGQSVYFSPAIDTYFANDWEIYGEQLPNLKNTIMDKTYILQKDLPNFKAGTKFICDVVGYMYQSEEKDIKGNIDAWASYLVENNPEWFKEEQSPMDKAYQQLLEEEYPENHEISKAFVKHYFEKGWNAAIQSQQQ